MTALPERKMLIELIQEAVQSGARLSKACEEAQIALRLIGAGLKPEWSRQIYDLKQIGPYRQTNSVMMSRTP